MICKSQLPDTFIQGIADHCQLTGNYSAAAGSGNGVIENLSTLMRFKPPAYIGG